LPPPGRGSPLPGNAAVHDGPAEPSGPGRGVPPAVTGALLLALAAAAGALDVLCVSRLGGSFASVITGNLVQAGRGVSGPELALLANSAVAVAGYALGVAAATLVLRGRPAGWFGAASVLAVVEVVLLAGVAAGWVGTGGAPDTVPAGVLLGLAGCAMGVQSALTLSTGLRGASTTYLTGTLTGVVQGAVAPSRHRPDRAGLQRLSAFLLGAVAGGFLLRFAPLWTPVLPLVLVAAATVVGAAARR
jgi:uncharacterized membrane protein YoaK (UPF0700 family)